MASPMRDSCLVAVPPAVDRYTTAKAPFLVLASRRAGTSGTRMGWTRWRAKRATRAIDPDLDPPPSHYRWSRTLMISSCRLTSACPVHRHSTKTVTLQPVDRRSCPSHPRSSSSSLIRRVTPPSPPLAHLLRPPHRRLRPRRCPDPVRPSPDPHRRCCGASTETAGTP